jgi:hypothetical protein
MRELWPFCFRSCMLSRKFQNAQPSVIRPYPLVGTSDWLDSWFVGSVTSWGFLISKDILFFSLEVVQKLMGTETSCELIRICWRPWSCGLRGVTSRLLWLEVVTIAGPASSMMAMVCLLHDFALVKVTGTFSAMWLLPTPIDWTNKPPQNISLKTLIDTLTYLV